MREAMVFVCSLMFFLEHLRKPERLLHVHFYFDAHCTSAFRVDSPISIWPHYISVNQEMKLMHSIITITIVSVLALFAIVGWLTADIIVALICLGTLIFISIIARLFQPWDEKKVIEKLNTQTQKKSNNNFQNDQR